MEYEALRKIANDIRINIIKMVSNAKSGHPGGSLGAADIVTFLYFNVMDITKENAGTNDRDRFVLSKGHASPLLYAVLAEKGIIPKEELLTFRLLHTSLQGHPDMNELDGIDMTTGSLGQGLSAAVGMCLANKLDKNDHRVYCLIGDGEAEEGQIWEAAMAAAHYKCDNLCAIIDNNGLQIDGPVDVVNTPYPIPDKFRAFNFHVIEVADGNDFEQLRAAFKEARETKGMPSAIIMKTVKGKGVSFMENQVGWHGKAPNDEEYAIAMEELKKAGEE